MFIRSIPHHPPCFKVFYIWCLVLVFWTWIFSPPSSFSRHVPRQRVHRSLRSPSMVFSTSIGAWSSSLPPPLPSALAPGGSKRFRLSLLLRGRPWAARDSHALPVTAPTLLEKLLFVFFFLCIYELCCHTPLPLCTLVFVFGLL